VSLHNHSVLRRVCISAINFRNTLKSPSGNLKTLRYTGAYQIDCFHVLHLFIFLSYASFAPLNHQGSNGQHRAEWEPRTSSSLSKENFKQEGNQDLYNIAPIYVVTHCFIIVLFVKLI